MSVRIAVWLLVASASVDASVFACTQPVPPSPRWRATLDAGYDPLVVYEPPQPKWAKFTIRTCDPTQVVFQDSWHYPLHHSFLSTEVPPFVGMTRQQLDAVTLFAADQQAVLGAVLIGPGEHWNFDDVGIQLVREDPYTREEALEALQAVSASIGLAHRFFYFPTATQRAAAEAESAWFEQNGFEVSSPARWARAGQVYLPGWAIGRLQYFASATIASAWASGALAPGDVLLTDEVPAEVPPVAGILALRPATPSSHVAILAETWKVPFGWLVGDDAARAQSLVGRRVVLRLRRDSMKLVEVDGHVDDAAVAELLAMKAPPPLDIEPIAALGAFSASTDGLTPSDVRHFGGKASNFGFLRRAIPDDSPVAAAFSFDLWTAFLDQRVPSGRTLREDVALRLAPHAWPPADMATLLQDLNGIRATFKDPLQTSFSPALQAAVIATLQDPRFGFDPSRNIRFRSSTNVEDAEDYTGAGLYESYSGCLLDDLDADTLGPSACDPSEADERGVFRAIRKVFASFYADNAHVERLRHGVDENEVGMALLAHHSFPDAVERANGVMIFDPAMAYWQLVVTSQAGAVSVTNPVPGELPEIMVGTVTPAFGLGFDLQQSSSLVQLGVTVLVRPTDYAELHRLATAVSDRMVLEGAAAGRRLEFEFKALEPDGRLEIKQVRPLPATDTGTTTPFLVNEPVTWCGQQRSNDVFATHRLKGRVTVSTESTRLTPEKIAAGFVTEVVHEYLDGCRWRSQSGLVSQRIGFVHSTEIEWIDLVSIDSWLQPDLVNPRRVALVLAGIPATVPEEDPLFFQSDLWDVSLRGEHARPVEVDAAGGDYWPGESLALGECLTFDPGQPIETRTARRDGIEVTSAYQFHPSGYGPCAHCQTPLVEFVSTAIVGLTTAPIVLTASASQSYRTEAHDWAQRLLFEPALDPGVPESTLAELDALGVRAISMRGYRGGDSDVVELHGDEIWGAPRCAPCTAGDGDDDGRCDDTDCDGSDPTHWGRPGDVGPLRFVGRDDLAWPVLFDAGATSFSFDVLRARDVGGLATSPTCLATGVPAGSLRDPESPGAGSAFFYLVRGVNGCPGGLGSLGSDSLSRPRTAPPCP